MPGPLDLLKKAWSIANTPMVPQSAIQGAQDSIDSPSLDRSPMEARIRGFGAGALEGARSLTTPLNMAGMALPMLRGLGIGKRASQAVNPAFDIVESSPVQQVAPSADDVGALIGDMQRNLARIPARRGAPPVETLGERAAEFTPVGAEDMYNVGRSTSLPKPTDIYEMVARRMGGRGK